MEKKGGEQKERWRNTGKRKDEKRQHIRGRREGRCKEKQDWI